MEAWELGVTWWKNSSEYWDLLTGARGVEVTTNTNPSYCICYDPNQSDPNIPDGDGDIETYNSPNCLPFKPSDICNTVPETTTTSISEFYKDNDGVVLNESAQGFNGVIKDYVLPLAGSNHFQMRNDESFKDALLFLYDNEEDDLTSFKTPKQTF